MTIHIGEMSGFPQIVAMLYLMEIKGEKEFIKKTWYTPIYGVGDEAPPHMFSIKT